MSVCKCVLSNLKCQSFLFSKISIVRCSSVLSSCSITYIFVYTFSQPFSTLWYSNYIQIICGLVGLILKQTCCVSLRCASLSARLYVCGVGLITLIDVLVICCQLCLQCLFCCELNIVIVTKQLNETRVDWMNVTTGTHNSQRPKQITTFLHFLKW